MKTEVRNIYEVFLDSVCLEESLLAYLIDLLRREDHEGFKKLSSGGAYPPGHGGLPRLAGAQGALG